MSAVLHRYRGRHQSSAVTAFMLRRIRPCLSTSSTFTFCERLRKPTMLVQKPTLFLQPASRALTGVSHDYVVIVPFEPGAKVLLVKNTIDLYAPC